MIRELFLLLFFVLLPTYVIWRMLRDHAPSQDDADEADKRV
jgi:hypothetical protein